MSPPPDATLDRLLALLPVHHVARDVGPDGSTGPLTALLTAVARELDVLETDVQRLHDAAFVETCEEWLLPYVADLVGLAEVPPDLGTTVSRRALVANTVAYRRRKGTLAVIEQVTRDVTGWSTSAVEYHPLLVATTHVNHVRLDRPAVASLRGDGVELGMVASPTSARRAMDPLAHTVEVRRIATRRGRYGIRSIGVFGFPTQVAAIGAPGPTGAPSVDPPLGSEGGWSRTRASLGWHHVDPLARAVPLFAPPVVEPSLEYLAGEENLAVPLRPRRLLELLAAARAGALDPTALPIGVRIGASGRDLPPERIRVCGLEDLAPGPQPQVMVDVVHGRLRAFHNAAQHYVPAVVFVRCALGSAADVGAGPWDRAERLEALLETDTWTPPVAVAGADGPEDLQVEVASSGPVGAQVDIVAGVGVVAAAWAAPDGTAVGATATVSVADSDRYSGDVVVAVPTGTRLVVVAAGWPARVLPDGDIQAPVAGSYTPEGLRPHVLGSVLVTGAPGASVVLDGLLIEGDVIVEAGDLGSLTLAHCTVTGSVVFRAGVAGSNAAASLRVVRSVVGAIRAGDTLPAVTVAESVLDPQDLDPGTPALATPGAHASIEGSTVRGVVSVRSLDATSCLLDGVVHVAHRQVGCVRFSYVAPGSRTPRRHRCVPRDDHPSPRPVYVSTDPASPAYLVLAASCSPAIRTGGERESEMGLHHHLFRPLRTRAAERQLASYVPVGSQLGVFGT